jgi:hypothetical protein
MPALLKTWFDRARRVDWRVWAVVASSVATLVATGIVYWFFYWFGWDLNPATHFGAIFASWVSGVALFIVVGSVVALASLAKPENWPFDSRARILFKRQTGNHIDYIIAKITEVLEHYAEQTVIKISIQDYEPTEKKYRISSANDVVVRSYLDDVPTAYSSHYELKDVTLPPPGRNPNRLVIIRVDKKPVGKPEDFADIIFRPLSCRIEKNKSCEINTVTEYWLQADDESNVHRPRRYTQRLSLHFENLTNSGQTVSVKVSRDGTSWVTEQLDHGASKQVLEVRDVKPDEIAFDFRILKP